MARNASTTLEAPIHGGSSPAEQLTIAGFLDNLTKKAEEYDPMRPAKRLFIVALALCGLGFLIQISHAATTRSPEGFVDEVRSQAAFRIAAIVTMLVCYRLGPSRLKRFLPHLVVVTCLLLLACFIEPFRAPLNGANRWVRLPLLGLQFQPSELARIVIVLWIADRCVRLGDRVFDLKRGVTPMLSLVSAFASLILFETDFGGSMIFLICALSTIWVGGVRLRPLGAWVFATCGGAIISASLFVPYTRDRIAMFLNQVENDQVTRSLDALSSGGVLGAGFTQGAFRNAGVPYLESDYVFALVGEELGLLGMWLVLALELCFLWFALRMVLSIRDRFDALASFGLLVSVALQAMVHVQVVSGLAPPKGMTLPFLSDGGTSLIVTSLAVGLALGAARKTHMELYECNP